MWHKIITIGLCAAFLSACEAPPSVQKVIEQEKAKEEAAKPRLENPAQRAAQEAGLEFYKIKLLGRWAPQGTCYDDKAGWTLKETSFQPPRQTPCRLEVVEELQDGSVAIAGYCPQVEYNAPTVLTVTLTGLDTMILNAERGGGPLVKCD